MLSVHVNTLAHDNCRKKKKKKNIKNTFTNKLQVLIGNKLERLSC